MALHVVTANALDSGAPVYLRGDADWTVRLAEASALAEPEAQARLEWARTDERRACDPYLIDVELDGDGRPRATSLRERIRAEGPTIPYGR
jgi:hypothetical protein